MAYRISEKCIGCTACAGLCPVLAISGERRERHSVNEKRCVECGVCGRVCRNGAVTDGGGNVCVPVPRVAWEKPGIDKKSCTACALCVSVCRAGALSISLPERRGDIHVAAVLSAPAKCVGCGLCGLECPLKLIVMKGGGPS
jgi:electron transport complex protein RnfB